MFSVEFFWKGDKCFTLIEDEKISIVLEMSEKEAKELKKKLKNREK